MRAHKSRRMVSQFRQALDRQGAALVSSASRSFTAPAKLPSSSSSSKRSANEIISVRTCARQFDAWLKGISRCSTLADAKRLRSDVTAQIRRAKTVTGMYYELSAGRPSLKSWLNGRLLPQMAANSKIVSKELRWLNGSTTSSGCTSRNARSISRSPNSEARPLD